MDLVFGAGALIRQRVEATLCENVEVRGSQMILTDRRVVYCAEAVQQDRTGHQLVWFLGVPRAIRPADFALFALDDPVEGLTEVIMPGSEFLTVARANGCTGNDDQWHPNLRTDLNRAYLWWSFPEVVYGLDGWRDNYGVLRGAGPRVAPAGDVPAQCPNCRRDGLSRHEGTPDQYRTRLRSVLPPRHQNSAIIGPSAPGRWETNWLCSACGAVGRGSDWATS